MSNNNGGLALLAGLLLAEVHSRYNRNCPVAFETLPEDWFNTAYRAGVYGLLLSAVKKKGWGLYDSPRVRSLQRSLVANEVFLVHSLERVLATLTARSVDVIVLKGPLLAREIYRDAVSRTCTDIDILVREAGLSTAVEALRADGYEPRSRPDESADMDEYHHKVLTRTFDSGFIAKVEIHNRLETLRFGSALPGADALFELSEKIEKPFPHLRFVPEMQLLHFIQQLCRDLGGIKRLADIEALVLALRPDPRRLVDLAERFDMLDALTFYRELRNSLAVEPILRLPSLNERKSRALRLLSGIGVDWYLSPDSNRGLRLISGCYIAGGLRAVLKYLLWWVFLPPRPVMARRVGLPGDSPFAGLLYPFSPVIALLHVLGFLPGSPPGS